MQNFQRHLINVRAEMVRKEMQEMRLRHATRVSLLDRVMKQAHGRTTTLASIGWRSATKICIKRIR